MYIYVCSRSKFREAFLFDTFFCLSACADVSPLVEQVSSTAGCCISASEVLAFRTFPPPHKSAHSHQHYTALHINAEHQLLG